VDKTNTFDKLLERSKKPVLKNMKMRMKKKNINKNNINS